MNILGIIPARYQSTRFPGKPLVKIDGKTMIQRVWEQVSKNLDHVVVATDDNRIADEVNLFGGKVIMTSADHPTGTDRCAEALSKYEEKTGISFDLAVNIQGDEPFIDPVQIKEISSIFKDPATEIGTLVKKIEDSQELFDENKPKVVFSGDGTALYFSRNPIPFLRGKEKADWIKKHTYYKHIGMYAFRAGVLPQLGKLQKGKLEQAESLEQLRWLEAGYKIKIAETGMETFSVDTPEDLENIKAAGLLTDYKLP